MPIEFRNKDCMEVMAEYPDNHFDLAIVDPPYGIGEDWKKRQKTSNKYDSTYKNSGIPDGEYFVELRRVAKNWIIWGWNYYIKYMEPTNYLICWDKISSDKAFYSQCELAGTSIPKPFRIFRHQWDGGKKGIETGITKIHPHQKPVALYKWLLKHYAEPGQKILDTHGGSMSSAIACHYFGCVLVICEIDKDHFEEGKARFEKETSQLDMAVMR